VDYLEFLFAGFAVFWGGLFVYLLWLQARLRAVQRDLERLEERLAESDAELDRARGASGGGAASGSPAEPSGAHERQTSS